MIKKATILFFTFLIIFSYFLFQKTMVVSSEDKNELNQLIKTTQNLKNATRSIKQCRQNIQKDIYYNNDKGRFHTKITGLSSDIHLELIKKKMKATEILHNIEFWMQEKIDGNSQKVKYLNAKCGKYFFPSHHFVSDEVDLAFFNSKGKKLSDIFDTNELLLQATAKHVFFQLNFKGASFKADHITVKIPEKHIKKRVFDASNKKSEKKL